MPEFHEEKKTEKIEPLNDETKSLLDCALKSSRQRDKRLYGHKLKINLPPITYDTVKNQRNEIERLEAELKVARENHQKDIDDLNGLLQYVQSQLEAERKKPIPSKPRTGW